MSGRQAFASALHLFVVLAFLGAGLFFVALPYLPHARIELIELFSNRMEKCTQIGMGFFLLSLLFLFGFYALNRGRYLVIQMGVSADIKGIRHAVEDCFFKQFSKRIALKDLEIGPKSLLELKVCLAPLDEAGREDLFIEVEKELSLLFKNRFGYSKPFHLIVRDAL